MRTFRHRIVDGPGSFGACCHDRRSTMRAASTGFMDRTGMRDNIGDTVVRPPDLLLGLAKSLIATRKV